MSSQIELKNGVRQVQYTINGMRRTVGLGKMSATSAKNFQTKLDKLLQTIQAGDRPEPEVAAWLDKLGSGLRLKLVKAGLVEGESHSPAGDLIDAYLAAKQKKIGFFAHRRMKTNLGYLRTFAAEVLKNKPVYKFTTADGEAMNAWMKEQEYAESTMRKALGDCRGFFRPLVEAGHLKKNPFSSVSVAATATEHHYFVSTAVANAVMKELPSARWRLLFALSRWGALRIPSEPKRLKRMHINLARRTIAVPGKRDNSGQLRNRTVPLFKEIEGPLLEVLAELPDDPNALLLPWLSTRTQTAPPRNALEAAIKRSGHQVWPRLWHNMRSTRLTEIVTHLPMHAACNYCGLTPAVAAKHYLQITDSHFEQALAMPLNLEVKP